MAASWCSKSQNNKTLRKLDVNFQKGKYLCSFLDCSLSLSFHFPLLASNQPLFTMPHPTLVTTSTTTFSRSQVQVLYFRFRSWSVTWFEYEPTNMFEYVSLVGAHPRPFPFRKEKDCDNSSGGNYFEQRKRDSAPVGRSTFEKILCERTEHRTVDGHKGIHHLLFALSSSPFHFICQMLSKYWGRKSFSLLLQWVARPFRDKMIRVQGTNMGLQQNLILDKILKRSVVVASFRGRI